MKTKIILIFSAIFLSISLHAQNSIDIINPPQSVNGNTEVAITFNYTLDAAQGWAYIRFKNGSATENNLTHKAVKIEGAGSGTKTVNLPIPSEFNGTTLPLGEGYSYQAQLFDSTGSSWVTLVTNDYNGVTLLEAVVPANFIDIKDHPKTVNAKGSVDITFDYATDRTDPVYAFIRLHNSSGQEVATTTSIKLSTSPGTKTVSLEIPDIALGGGHEYRALIFHPSNWGVALSTDKVTGITVEEAIVTTPVNTITIVEPTTTVYNDRNIDYNLSYTKDEAIAEAYVLIRFKGPSGNLKQAFVKVSEDAGVVKVSVKSPATAGTNYSLQAQLYTIGWSELDTYNLSGITVEEYVPTGENTLEIVNTSTDPINNGSLRQVSVKYNLLQTSKILVEVRNKETTTGSKKIGEVWVELPPSSGTITLDLIVDNGWPGTKNRIQAVLFEGGNSWQSISIPQIPFIIVDKGDGTITYRGQPYTADGSQNNLFSESLGEGYYTNYYIATGWKGPLKMKFGKAGTPSWIEYENQNKVSDGHKEFDIKIQKFSWHEHKDFFTDRGFPTAIKDITFPLDASLEGQWSAGSKGKGQINMTAWVTENGDMSGNRVDIIVHAFDNGGNFRKKYDDEQDRFRNIGEFTANNGLTYQILRALPGFLGEVASYNLVPDAIVQADPRADYTNEVITSNIDMKNIIDNLIAKEAAYTGSQGQVGINNNWQINGLEWTVVGQSGNADTDGKMIPNGRGKFTFNSYTIPNLVDPALSTDNVDSKLNSLTIFPNPFKDSFTYKYDSQLNDLINVELFTIDGRKIETIKKKNASLENSVTVETGHLSKGIYLLRITLGDVQKTQKLIKM